MIARGTKGHRRAGRSGRVQNRMTARVFRLTALNHLTYIKVGTHTALECFFQVLLCWFSDKIYYATVVADFELIINSPLDNFNGITPSPDGIYKANYYCKHLNIVRSIFQQFNYNDHTLKNTLITTE